MDKNKAMPVGEGKLSTGINKKYEEPLFGTLPIMDNAKRNPKTGVPIPSAMAIDEAKEWVDNGSRL